MLVTFAACRRCNTTRRPSHVSDGKLMCGRCGEPLPILEEGVTLPIEKNCTPVSASFKIDGGSLAIRAADVESGRSSFARNQDWLPNPHQPWISSTPIIPRSSWSRMWQWYMALPIKSRNAVRTRIREFA